MPFLNLGLGFPFSAAAAISLTTVIATSSTVSAGKAGKQLINMKLGMLLEVATAAGSFLGGVTAQFVSQSVLQRLFGAVAVIVALIMLSRLRKRNVILDPAAAPGVLGGRYHEEESGGTITYRVKRVPLAIAASFVAGNVSSLLGIGGGIIKVPVLNAWCGVPLRAAAATSAFMIGVTATAGAVIYYGHGQLDAGAGGRGGPRRAARIVGRPEVRRRGVGEVAEDPDGRGPLHRLRDDVPAGRTMKLERLIGTVLRAGVMASSACLAIGLVLSLATGSGPVSSFLLNAGIVVLLATPVARVIVSTIQYVIERDWTFATLTFVVLLELVASAVAALVFNRRI